MVVYEGVHAASVCCELRTFAPKVDSWLYLHGKTHKRVVGVSLSNQVGCVCAERATSYGPSLFFDCNLVLMPRAGTQRTLVGEQKGGGAGCV